jgi:hypothetical protein
MALFTKSFGPSRAAWSYFEVRSMKIPSKFFLTIKPFSLFKILNFIFKFSPFVSIN